jgi:hypothetical protein
MGAAVKKLTDCVTSPTVHDTPWTDVVPQQIAAANEQLQERVGAIKLLANRAEAANLKAVRDLNDLVPLLFAHTSYKSYPESWLTGGKWDRMNRWLDTLTTDRIDVDVKGVGDIDDWAARLDTAGVHLSCSSGTTGKCSIIPTNMADRLFFRQSMARSFTWATGVKAEHQYLQLRIGPIPQNARNEDGRACLVENFAHTFRPFPGEPITVGQVNKMVALRRSIADGTAQPADIAAFEATSAARAKAVDEALQDLINLIAEKRSEKILFWGGFATMFQVAEALRARGLSAKDFNDQNTYATAGGLKGIKLPADYRERVFETLNLSPAHVFHFYSMQEINTAMPRCRADRYHVPPWLIFLVLDQTGENLIPGGKGEIEGRAAFFDLSMTGRWCGLISGDKVRVDYGKCACGHQGPTVHHEITRYSDLPGGDKISCAGTIDAYIRGAV